MCALLVLDARAILDAEGARPSHSVGEDFLLVLREREREREREKERKKERERERV